MKSKIFPNSRKGVASNLLFSLCDLEGKHKIIVINPYSGEHKKYRDVINNHKNIRGMSFGKNRAK